VAMQEIFIGGKSQIVIMCLKCGREKTLDVSKLKGITKQVKVKCTCGYAFEVVFEKRAYYRKQTRLSGSYAKVGRSGFPDPMTVLNLSKGGLGFESMSNGDTQEGDILRVEFTLDNASRAVIKAEVSVRIVNGRYIGGEFRSLDEYAKRTLGFYLMP
jgi:hypothetical protein